MNKNALLIGGGVAVLATLLFLGKQTPAITQTRQNGMVGAFHANPMTYNITTPNIIIPPIVLPPNPDYGGYGGISACGCPGSASAVPASELPQGNLYSFTPENVAPYLLQSTVPIFPNG